MVHVASDDSSADERRRFWVVGRAAARGVRAKRVLELACGSRRPVTQTQSCAPCLNFNVSSLNFLRNHKKTQNEKEQIISKRI